MEGEPPGEMLQVKSPLDQRPLLSKIALMTTTGRWGLVLVLLSAGCFLSPLSAEEQAPVDPSVVWREPKTVTLKLEDGATVSDSFPKTPYVEENTVYIYPGEAFSIALQIENGKITGIRYDKDGKAPERIDFKFEQHTKNGKHEVMMLIAKSHVSKDVLYDAYMLLPKRNKHVQTSQLPLQAGLGAYESWGDPIEQLVLNHFRIVGCEPKK